ncbi:MAG: hypothetical protein J6M08_02130 [Methanobrevibacter sp.]|nr:hypothetical protein [Methanobrevibacter sp.]
MTEKDVYKNGVALLEEWEDVNYCEHSFKFKDEWLTDKEVVDLLNELAEENNGLKAENEQLKQRVQQLENNIEKYIGAKYKKFVDGEVGGWSIGTVNELLNELSDENR